MTKATDNRPQFFLIEDAVVEKCNLDPYSGWLYVVIAKHADRKTGEAFPGIARLAKLANMSRSQVLRAIRVLEEKHLIRVQRDELPLKGEKRQREKNHYFLLSATGSSYQTLGVVSMGNYPSSQQELGVVSGVDHNKNQLEPESITSKSRKRDPYFDAISEIFKSNAGGWIGNLKAMMLGTSKRGEWKRCNFDPPVTDPAEIRDFGVYMRKRMAEKNLTDPPSACVTIQRWFYDFRDEMVRQAARKTIQLDPAHDLSILVPFDAPLDRFLKEQEGAS